MPRITPILQTISIRTAPNSTDRSRIATKMNHQPTPPNGEPTVRSQAMNDLGQSSAPRASSGDRLLDRLTFLEFENRRLSALVAALSLDNQILEQLVRKP